MSVCRKRTLRKAELIALLSFTGPGMTDGQLDMHAFHQTFQILHLITIPEIFSYF